jgi:carbon starvation protein
VLIKMGRVRHLWVTLAPLAWLLAVTMTAGWMKIFSPAPLGFLAIARGLEQRLAFGVSRAEAVTLRAQIFNNRVDAAVTAVFMILVTIVVVANARVWWQLLVGKRAAELHEEPYVAIAEPAKA